MFSGLLAQTKEDPPKEDDKKDANDDGDDGERPTELRSHEKLLNKYLPSAFHFNVYTQTDFSEDWDNSFDEEELSEEIASESSDGFF